MDHLARTQELLVDHISSLPTGVAVARAEGLQGVYAALRGTTEAVTDEDVDKMDDPLSIHLCAIHNVFYSMCMVNDTHKCQSIPMYSR